MKFEVGKGGLPPATSERAIRKSGGKPPFPTSSMLSSLASHNALEVGAAIPRYHLRRLDSLGYILCRLLNRVDDLDISRTSAQVACDRFFDLLATRVCVLVQESASRNQHPRRADPALRPSALKKGSLQRIELSVGR